jgi:DNA-damage-inducible protein J
MTKTAVITVKVDKKLKEDAQEVLATMGLTLSSYITASLKKVVTERRVEFVAEEKMAPSPKKIVEVARANRKEGKNISPRFDNAKDAGAYLRGKVKK